jgi:hypothetical protein
VALTLLCVGHGASVLSDSLMSYSLTDIDDRSDVSHATRIWPSDLSDHPRARPAETFAADIDLRFSGPDHRRV